MVIETINNIVRIVSDDGKALHRIGDEDSTAFSSEVWLSSSDSPDNWEEFDEQQQQEFLAQLNERLESCQNTPTPESIIL